MTFATLTGLLIFCVALFMIIITAAGTILTVSSTTPAIPSEGVLKIDMASLTLTEQASEPDLTQLLQQNGEIIAPIGVLEAARAIDAAAIDPTIKYIFMKPDMVSGGFGHIEEFRKALEEFRKSGKAIVSYIENPTNGGYYLASVSDKIYMTSHLGCNSMFTGISSKMFFLKDILDKLGIGVQLIRHGKYKSAGEMYTRSSPSKENLQQNEELINSIWDTWAAQISCSRNITPETLNAMLEELELASSEDFLKNNLVDELVTGEQLKQKLADLYITDSYNNVKMIPLQDYSKMQSAIKTMKPKTKVAVLYADGNIIEGDIKQQVAGDRYAGMIADIRKDTTIKALVLRVNSPGGSVLAAEKIKAELDILKESTPIVASYGNYAASGGYWISANADRIFTDASTLTGSIGVFSMIPNTGRMLEDKIGINVTTINSHSHADMFSLMRPLDMSEEAYMQKTVEDVYTRFTTLVSEGRDMPVAEVDAIAQGRVWSGVQATELGLADQTGCLKDAIVFAAFSIEGVESLADVDIVEYPKPRTTIDILLESLGTRANILEDTPLENISEAFRAWNPNEGVKTYARIPYEIILN